LAQFTFSAPVDIDYLADQITEYAASKKAEGHWQIGRLGTLKIDGEQAIWNPSPVSEWSALADLPDIQLPNPVVSEASTVASENSAAAVASGISESKASPSNDPSSSRSLFIILVLVLLLALTMIIGSLWFWGPLSNRSITEVDLPVQKERLNVKPDEVESSIKRTSVQHTPSSDSAASFELNHRKTVVKSAASDSAYTHSLDESAATDNGPAEAEAGTGESVSSDCVIIVGAFSRELYIEKMEALLSSKGYQIYLAPAGGLTRVGLYAPCTPPEFLAELRTVRKEIEPRAWILNE
jgi:cell division septation protein DedD